MVKKRRATKTKIKRKRTAKKNKPPTDEPAKPYVPGIPT